MVNGSILASPWRTSECGNCLHRVVPLGWPKRNSPRKFRNWRPFGIVSVGDDVDAPDNQYLAARAGQSPFGDSRYPAVIEKRFNRRFRASLDYAHGRCGGSTAGRAASRRESGGHCLPGFVCRGVGDPVTRWPEYFAPPAREVIRRGRAQRTRNSVGGDEPINAPAGEGELPPCVGVNRTARGRICGPLRAPQVREQSGSESRPFAHLVTAPGHRVADGDGRGGERLPTLRTVTVCDALPVRRSGVVGESRIAGPAVVAVVARRSAI